MSTVHRVDTEDPRAYEQWYDVYARSFTRVFDHPYGPAEKRVGLRPDEYGSSIVVIAHDDDGTAVGGACAQLPLTDNTGFAYVELFVVPEARRRGHGSALLDHIAADARAAGRSTLLVEAYWAVDDDIAPARAFCEARGLTLDLMDAQRELTLPASLPALDVDPDYEIRTWRGACPPDWLDGYADLRRLMVQEAPSGEAGLENEQWDGVRVRHEEEQWVAQERTAQISVALASDGTLVGHTQLLFPADSDEVYQWDTLVLPEHRGHGLGLALKVFTMQQSADLLAGRRRVNTDNAAVNAPMIAVNNALGFRQVAWVGEYVLAL